MVNAKSFYIAAVLALSLAREGHVGVTTLKTLKLTELVERAGIIVLASPIKPLDAKEWLAFPDSGTNQGGATNGSAKPSVPPLERKVWRFLLSETLKNQDGSALPETLMVYDANTAVSASGHASAHSGGSVESPITYAYASSIKETKLGKEKSVLLFLNRKQEAGITPSEWLEFAATEGYEKGSKAKKVAKLLPKSEEPLPINRD
jgi:hypothetical protein